MISQGDALRPQPKTITMPQSLVKLATHITFGTKHRQPFVDAVVGKSLYACLGAVCKEMDCIPIKIGGYTDHVHVLCLLSRKVALMGLLEETKKRSSKRIKGEGERYQNFYRQEGYGAFSVNPTEIEKVIAYIENQHEHHRKMTFQDECRGFLKRYEVDYDERCVWD